MTQVVNTAEWAGGEDSGELDLDVPENSTEEDDKLREYWAKKERRRSSILKDFVGDSLGLKDNQRIFMHLTKFGENIHVLAYRVSDHTFRVVNYGNWHCCKVPMLHNSTVKLHWIRHFVVVVDLLPHAFPLSFPPIHTTPHGALQERVQYCSQTL